MPPPAFLMTLNHWDEGEGQPRVELDLPRVLHAEQKFAYLKPVYVGDVLTGLTTVTKLFEKTGGRGGKMTFVVMDTECTNQNGENSIEGDGAALNSKGEVGITGSFRAALPSRG